MLPRCFLARSARWVGVCLSEVIARCRHLDPCCSQRRNEFLGEKQRQMARLARNLARNIRGLFVRGTNSMGSSQVTS